MDRATVKAELQSFSSGARKTVPGAAPGGGSSGGAAAPHGGGPSASGGPHGAIVAAGGLGGLGAISAGGGAVAASEATAKNQQRKKGDPKKGNPTFGAMPPRTSKGGNLRVKDIVKDMTDRIKEDVLEDCWIGVEYQYHSALIISTSGVMLVI